MGVSDYGIVLRAGGVPGLPLSSLGIWNAIMRL